MREGRTQKILLLLPFAVLLTGTLLTLTLFLRAYRQTAFEHTSALCEIILENTPEAEPQLLEALKDYHALTEQELKGNSYLEKYGYRMDDFCKGFPLDIFLFPLLSFLASACAFAFGLQDEIYKTVTTLYQTREAAVAAKKNFAENLTNIAHQLKTPITASCLSLQLLKQECPGTYAAQIGRQLERLSRLEESLLTLSRIDAGALPLKQEKVDLYTVLNLAADNLDDLLRKNHISVEIPENGCIEFSGDLEWTMEALINLFKNCMEHSRPGGTVHCDYAGNPLYVQIRIWDEGAGFDTEDLPHLFERFYRGRGAAGDGIGIGLALARSIFELQNGILSACNLQNGGACFEIRIYSH